MLYLSPCPMIENGTIPESEPLVNGEAKEGELIRIVIADDHPIFRDGLRKLLTLEDDFRVVAEARDGKEVLEVLDEHQPDILLLDLKMPGLDGLTALQKLQNSRTKTKVIVLTASEDKNQFVQAMKFGTCGIVLKQTATELLIKSIRKVHAGEIWLDSHTTAAVMRQFSSPMDSAPVGCRAADCSDWRPGFLRPGRQSDRSCRRRRKKYQKGGSSAHRSSIAGSFRCHDRA